MQFVQVKIIHEFEYESIWSDQLLAISVKWSIFLLQPTPFTFKIKR